MATKDEVKEYYDTFKEHQKKLGINIRHRTILKNLKNAGLKTNSNVLEIGCGIGTVSHLILKQIPEGSFVGLDISSESIKMAQQFNAFHKKAEFMVNDMSNFTHKTKFDFVVFPDVLEHIPVEQHANIFKTISELTTPNATVIINIPEPNYLDWIRKNEPNRLQIIDQSLSMQDLLNNCYPYGFKVYSIIPYALHYDVNDYLAIVLKKDMTVKQIQLKGTLERAIANTKSKLG
ncbi:MAG TPA: methyltransferase domain-containing protein [Bacteroidia bacterium]|nr:methyltransferase domain-containing protein [Bacteroidia bacterium]